MFRPMDVQNTCVRQSFMRAEFFAMWLGYLSSTGINDSAACIDAVMAWIRFVLFFSPVAELSMRLQYEPMLDI